MRLRKQLRRVGLALLGAVLLIGLYVWWFAWRSPPHYTKYDRIDLPVPILTSEEYGAVISRHARPFIVSLSGDQGAVLLYGAEHTKNPDDPQIADLHQRWNEFQPTVALIEGRLGFLLPGFGDPVRKFGENGAVHALARKRGVPVFTWELPIDQEVAVALEAHSSERVALFYVLRPYFGNLRHGRPADPNGFVEEYRRRRTQWPGLENTVGSVADIDAIWRRDFSDVADWRDTSDQYGLPGYLKEIGTRTNAARDEHFARVILHLVREGHRVFAVAGSSHAVKLEPALRAALGGERPRHKDETDAGTK